MAALSSVEARPSTSELVLRQVDQGSNFTFKAASFNIRYGRPDNITIDQTIANISSIDPLEKPSAFYANMTERPWSERRVPLVEELLWNDISLAGFQEVLYNQLTDMDTLLRDVASEFQHVGVGRANGLEIPNGTVKGSNEYSPVFYKNDVFTLQSYDTFWLSDTPFDISMAANTTNYRICTTAFFSTPAGDLTVMATHWDEKSDPARALSASLILQRAKHEVERTSRPVLLFGDFNSVSSAVEGDSTGYQIITGELPMQDINSTFMDRYPVTSENTFSFVNLQTATPPRRRSGNFATFSGFTDVSSSSAVNRSYSQIDFIFGSSNGGWTSKAFKHGSNFYDDGLISSDHRPVFAEIELQSGQFPL